MPNLPLPLPSSSSKPPLAGVLRAPVPAVLRNVPPSKNKSIAKLRKNWSWMTWPVDKEEQKRFFVEARWDPQHEVGIIFATSEFWEVLHSDEVGTDSEAALDVLLQIRAEAEAYPGRVSVGDLPENIGARLVPLDPAHAFKDDVNALVQIVLATEPAKRDEYMGRYAELRERLESMQQAIMEAEGMLDVVRDGLSAAGRASSPHRAEVATS